MREGQEALAVYMPTEEPAHQSEQQRTEPEAASREPIQPGAPEGRLESPQPLEEEQNSVHVQHAEVRQPAKPLLPTEMKIETEPEKQQNSGTRTGVSTRQGQSERVPKHSKRSKSSFDWAELSGDDDPEIGFSEWKERNLPGYQTQPGGSGSGVVRKPEEPPYEAAREHYTPVSQAQPAKPKVLVKTKQKSAESTTSTVATTGARPLQAVSDAIPRKMLWSQVIRGSPATSVSLEQAQRRPRLMTISDQKKSAHPWRWAQAHQQPNAQDEDFPTLTTNEKGKQRDRKTWKWVHPSEQVSTSTGKAKGKQPEPVNSFQALEPLVERSASTVNTGSPKEESD